MALLVVAQGTGTQFITGPCKSDADCASGCCGFKTGKCAGAIIALERDGGCGFGDPQPNDNAARKLRGQAPATPSTLVSVVKPAATPNNAAGNGAGNGAGKQFITGPCTGDADCASGCCGFRTGKCAGAIVAQERDGGCGFGNATPNDNAARILRGQAPAAPASSPTAAAKQAPATGQALAANPNGAGNKAGKQFITGVCTSDADCASGCCGFKTGKCAGAIVAQERDGGCGFGDATPNDTAARKLRGQA